VDENNDALVDWHVTKESSFNHLFSDAGTFIFEVVAIDRDLNYSEPASLTLTIVLPWYKNGWILYPSAGGIIALMVFSGILGYRYYQERQQVLVYQQLAVSELQDARRVQMGLMPEVAPEIEGLAIAGKCLSANTVSGDFFDYLPAPDGSEIAIVVGDVTGHGMQGAMNAVMADGILRAIAAEIKTLAPTTLMAKVNNTLHPQMESGMNVTMVIGHINAAAKTLQLANAGHHAHPLLIRTGEIQPLQAKGMPLGMMAGIPYREVEFSLQSGDVVVFMTDGIIEVRDSDGTYYADSGLLEAAISQFASSLSAEGIVDVIFNDAMAFGGDSTKRDDDMTVVVVKVQ
jgi:sigma-B regulation protein RsbU (phosphoserine phosphatase)